MVLVVVPIIVVVVVIVVVYSNVNTQTKEQHQQQQQKPSECVVMALLGITMQLQRCTSFLSDFVEISRWHVCSSYSDC